MSHIPDILRKIIEYKQEELKAVKSALPFAELRDRLSYPAPVRGFAASLERAATDGRTAIIAEVKKGSPSKGVIRADFDPLAISSVYEENGASCLSVLTDEHFFQGNLSYLSGINKEVNIPILRNSSGNRLQTDRH